MQQIRYFLAVSGHLNFTLAAAACTVSQPSLTLAIKLLEDERGGALFHRERANTRRAVLGRIVLPPLRQVHNETRIATGVAKDFTWLKKSRRKIGITCTIAVQNRSFARLNCRTIVNSMRR